MAQHKSAKKRARQALKRRARNRHVRGTVKTAVKNARQALAAGDEEKVRDALREAESRIRRAASKGVVPKARASRQISRLAKAAERASSSAS